MYLYVSIEEVYYAKYSARRYGALRSIVQIGNGDFSVTQKNASKMFQIT